MRDVDAADTAATTATGAAAAAVAPFVMLGDDAALCVDGVCAVPVAAHGATSGGAATR